MYILYYINFIIKLGYRGKNCCFQCAPIEHEKMLNSIILKKSITIKNTIFYEMVKYSK
jgi:hypothetical protein